MLLRRTASVAALIVPEVAALVTLHRLGSYEAAAVRWDDLSGWLAQTPPEDAIVAVVRLAALALAWWLTASTVLYALASATKIPGLVRGVRWATVAPVRRMIDGALATTILFGSTLTAPSAAAVAPADRAVVVQPDELGLQADESSQPVYQPSPASDDPHAIYEPKPANDPPLTPLTTRDSPPNTFPAPPANEAATILGEALYSVRPGDNLWAIASWHLTVISGSPADDLKTEDIRTYWLQLIEDNAGRLRSDDPALIWPGEQIRLP